MGHKKEKPEEEEGGGEGAPLWYMSFADMATLLLSFFVVMTTFSSFDKASIKKIVGIFHYVADNSIFPAKERQKDSFVPPSEKSVQAYDGSEKPTAAAPEKDRNPAVLPFIASCEAFKDRKILSLPASAVFWGQGVSLRTEAQQGLQAVAGFLQKMSCQVIVQETTRLDPEKKLQRSSQVAAFLVRNGVPEDLCGVSLNESPAAARGPDLVQIVLLSRSSGK